MTVVFQYEAPGKYRENIRNKESNSKTHHDMRNEINLKVEETFIHKVIGIFHNFKLIIPLQSINLPTSLICQLM